MVNQRFSARSQTRATGATRGLLHAAVLGALLLVNGPVLATRGHHAVRQLPVEPVSRLPVEERPETTSRLVIYYHDGTTPLSKQVGISLPAGPVVISPDKHGEPLDLRDPTTVPVSSFARPVKIDLPAEMSISEARAYAAEIEIDPDVKAVLVDRKVVRHGISSNDTYAFALWNLEDTDAGTTHTEPVWPQGKGTGVTVAVLDTGMVEHPDMSGAWVGGYDMISDGALAGDGNGRDADPTDTMLCDNGTGAVSTSPHGLMVGSVIAARMNNSQGVAGVAPTAQIMPVRVIGGCGGYLSDVLDGMRWAAGLAVSDLPLNPNPARILNLSLGTTDPGAVCSAAVQSVIDEVRATGATIVVSTGNDGADQISVPAACQGVIAVTANTRTGQRADYGNAGAGTTLSAAGGGCSTQDPASCALTSTNYIAVASHNTTEPNYVMSAGTSFSAPHVSAAAALLLERNPARTPDQIKSALTNTARAFEPGACDEGLCGAGILDTNQALAFSGFTLAVTTPNAVVRANEVVVLTARVSDDARDPVYEWRQLAGPNVPISVSADGLNASIVTPDSRQSLEFEVQATDSSGARRSATLTLQVTVAPALAPIEPVRVLPGETVREPVTLVSGATPEALRLDAVATAKGIRIENNQVVWDEARDGSHEVQITPYDAIGPGEPTTFTIEVDAKVGQDAAMDSSGQGNGTGGGGALGLHGALLLMLAAIMRRRLYASR